MSVDVGVVGTVVRPSAVWSYQPAFSERGVGIAGGADCGGENLGRGW